MMKMIFALLTLAPVIAWGQVYKCVDEQGRTVYSQSPCAEDAAEMDVQTQTPPSSGTGLSEAERQRLQQMREDLAVQRQQREKEAAVRRAQGPVEQPWERKKRMEAANMAGVPVLDMTPDEVRRATGNQPGGLDFSITGAGTEQWGYVQTGRGNLVYLKFQGGRVTEISNTRPVKVD